MKNHENISLWTLILLYNFGWWYEKKKLRFTCIQKLRMIFSYLFTSFSTIWSSVVFWFDYKVVPIMLLLRNLCRKKSAFIPLSSSFFETTIPYLTNTNQLFCWFNSRLRPSLEIFYFAQCEVKGAEDECYMLQSHKVKYENPNTFVSYFLSKLPEKKLYVLCATKFNFLR